jgi:hypothetical protein
MATSAELDRWATSVRSEPHTQVGTWLWDWSNPSFEATLTVVGHGGVREVQSPDPIAMIRRQPRECRVVESLAEERHDNGPIHIQQSQKPAHRLRPPRATPPPAR